MALWTAQYRYNGADRYDVTAKANNIFSPPWKLVSAYKNAEARAALLPDKVKAEELMRAAKLLYKDDYIKHLVNGINADTNNFGWLLNHIDEYDLTFVCYCNVKKTGFCHRILAAEHVSCWYGVEYMGEREL